MPTGVILPETLKNIGEEEKDNYGVYQILDVNGG